MNTFQRYNFAFTGVLLFLLAATTGCGFDPSEHVHSQDRPDYVNDNGQIWIAEKLEGENDEWFWVPWQVAAVRPGARWTDGDSIDVLVEGHVWRVTQREGNTFALGPIDPPLDFPTIARWVLSIIIAAGGGIVGIKGLICASEDRKKRQGAENSLEEMKVKDKEREREFRREKSEFERYRKEVEADLASKCDAAAAERAALDTQVKALTLAARESKPTVAIPTADQWMKGSKLVRARAFSGQVPGNGLIINYFFDPMGSGLITFQWEITLERPYPPAFVATRNGRTIHKASNMIRGEFSDHFADPARRHRYCFKLVDGSKTLSDPAVAELTMPPCKAIDPKPVKPEPPEDRRRRKEAWRREQYAQIEQCGETPADIQSAKAAIDEETNRRYGEE